ncbi:MAG: hypothetical protein HXX18_04040 [Bacteroidetes bacterium]|nr:hypothetical protein [Bacteroidota bacterium]
MIKQLLLLSFLILLCFFSEAQDISTIKQQKPFTFSGNLDIRGIAYNMQGMDSRRKPFAWYIFGSPTFTFYGFSVPLSFSLSDQEKTFSQPFNQFGLSPHYKWITIHLGYRNINFSPYTLAGHTIYGAGVELKPGNFRFGFMYGRLNKGIEVDSTTGYFQAASFTRYGYAAKIGYGSQKNYLDISFLKASDDTTSINQVNIDSSKRVKPEANIVGSIVTHITLSSHLFFDGDLGLSIYTNNVNSSLKLPELEKYNFILPVNLSTQKYIAYSAAFGYKQKYFSLKLAYKWVEPGFKSMGSYFFNSDLEQISIAPAFQVLKNRLRFSGNIGLQRDNVRKQKTATTNRTVFSGGLNIDFTKKMGLDISISNYSMNSTPQVSLVNRKYLLTNTSRSYSFSPRYIIAKQNISQMINGNFTLSQLIDANTTTQSINEIETKMAFVSYSLNFLKTNLSLNTSVNFIINTIKSEDTKNYGLNAGINKGVFKNKIQLGTNVSYTLSQSKTSSNVLNLGLNCQYNISKHNRIYIRWLMLLNKPIEAGSIPSFTENTGEFGYSFSL